MQWIRQFKSKILVFFLYKYIYIIKRKGRKGRQADGRAGERKRERERQWA